MSSYSIEALGLKRVLTRFERMEVATLDATPAMRSVAEYMLAAIRATFESQGRRGGGSWRHLTADWMFTKSQKHLDPRIGFASHALFDAFEMIGAPHQIIDITRHSVTLGSDLPYTGTQQEHRPIAKFTQGDALNMRNIVRDYLLGAWEAGVSTER